MHLFIKNFIEDPRVFLKKHLISITLGLIGLIFFTYGAILLFGHFESSSDISFESGNDNAEEKSKGRSLVIDIEGAVLRPGVYRLSEDARLQDVLIASGGLSSSADRAWIEKHINLAAKLSDGAKIYIPTNTESSFSQNARTTQSTSQNQSVLGSVDNLISINSATAAQLDQLPSIGPVSAQKIIDNRPYLSIDELVTKKAVSTKTLEKIKDKISL